VASRPSTVRAAALIGALALIWGGTYVLIVVALRDMSAPGIAFIRAVAGLALVSAVRPSALRPAWAFIRRRPVAALALCAFNLALPFWLIPLGEATVAAGMTSVLLATSPALVAIGAGWTDRERLSPVQWSGVLLALLGVAIAVGAAPGQAHSVLGVVAILAAAASYAAGSLSAKWGAAGLSPWEQALVTLMLGSVLLLGPALVSAPHQAPSTDGLLALAGLTVFGTVLSFLLLFAAVRMGGAGFSIRPIFLSPAVSIAGGALLLGETVTGGLALGAVLSVAGVMMATGGHPSRARVAAAEVPIEAC
jgi:drug/metabolite transporter (DMT)-like permease